MYGRRIKFMEMTVIYIPLVLVQAHFHSAAAGKTSSFVVVADDYGNDVEGVCRVCVGGQDC